MTIKNLETLIRDAIRTLTLPPTKSEGPLVIFFVGPPATGKSYLSKTILSVFSMTEVSRENMAAYLTPKITFFKRGDDEILELAEGVILELVKQKYNVLFDANFKKRSERLNLQEKIEAAGGKTLVIYMTCPPGLALKRINAHNLEVNKGLKKGFIMDQDYFYYEVNTSETPRAPEDFLTYDSSLDGVQLKKLLARIRQKLS